MIQDWQVPQPQAKERSTAIWQGGVRARGVSGTRFIMGRGPEGVKAWGGTRLVARGAGQGKLQPLSRRGGPRGSTRRSRGEVCQTRCGSGRWLSPQGKRGA